jgi:Ni/Fe-hydrogenase subunit HybB-like protein
VLCGIGLGGAGFTIMAAVYVFNAERFRPIVRPAILLAFLAYSSAAVALAVDIGRTWNIWHPIVFWNDQSVLFDVAWCLMLYTGVLILEGSGMLFERMGWKRLLKAQHAITLPIVLVGVVLSTLHQSSLGSLFLIVPGKLHAIWYTPMLPVFFFMSAVCVGLATLILLARLTGTAFGARIDESIVSGLARVLVAGVWVYGVTRIFDLWHRGALGAALDGSYESRMFLLEFGLLVVLPAAVLGIPALHRKIGGLYAGAILVVLGFIANRLNVSITGFEWHQGGHYVPAVSEVLIGLMIPALAFGAYTWIARRLDLFPARAKSPLAAAIPSAPGTALAAH